MTNGFTQVENDEIDRLVRDEGLSLNEAVACVSRNFGRFCPYSDCGKALSKPMEHHVRWGDSFPYLFDTAVSKKLLYYSLKQCGFKKIIELKHTKNWLPLRWYARYCTLVCLK